jgi:hypothetical protein
MLSRIPKDWRAVVWLVLVPLCVALLVLGAIGLAGAQSPKPASGALSVSQRVLVVRAPSHPASLHARRVHSARRWHAERVHAADVIWQARVDAWTPTQRCEEPNWHVQPWGGLGDKVWTLMGGTQFAPTAGDASPRDQVAVACRIQIEPPWSSWTSCSGYRGW